MQIRTAVAAAAAVVAASSTAAQAHVSLHPNTVPAGAFATLDVRVPGEQRGAHVAKVDMLLPPGFVSVEYADVPGWKAKVLESKLAKPLQTDDGPIDTHVSQIVWTWTGPEGRVADGQFAELPLSVAIPDGDTGQTLTFKTIQTYSDGKVVRWIGPPSSEEPAPTIDVTAKGGAIEDVAGGEAGPAPGQGSVPAVASKGASEGLGIAALILGALGLLTGLAALLATRRTRSAR